MNQSSQYKSNYTKPERTNPEINVERDALDSVRKSRVTSASKGKFKLSTPVKISALALVFAGVVLSVWTMKSSRSFMEDDDLPTIANDFGANAFKVEPGEEDAIQAPHSDKEFYSELEPAKPTGNKEAFRATPETPSKQVSQEALFAEGNKISEAEAVFEEKAVNKELSPSSKGTDTPAKPIVAVAVVEAANDAPATYKAPAPTVSITKPRKTLEMAIGETQQSMRKTAQSLVHDRSLSKAQLGKANSAVKKDVAARHEVPKSSANSKSVPLKSASTLAAVKAKTVTPSSVATGSYWVQIASLPTQAAAQKEWTRLQRKVPTLLKGQNYKTVRVDLGKPTGIRYRVHVGPFSKTTAVQKCQGLKGSSLGCLVVKKK